MGTVNHNISHNTIEEIDEQKGQTESINRKHKQKGKISWIIILENRKKQRRII